MADDLGERTEEATPKKRQEAREEGNVARSQDLAGAFLLLVATLALWMVAVQMFGQGKAVIGQALSFESVGNTFEPKDTWTMVGWIGGLAIRIVAPILLIAWLAALISHFGQIGLVFSPKALQPQLKRLNPISGFQRVFGLSAIVKAGLDSLKVLVVMIVAVLTIVQRRDEILVLPYLTVLESLATVGYMMLDLALRAVAVLVLLGIIDLLYQRWKHSKDLRMTKQQVKDEMKTTDGDPEVKARRSRIQQQISMQRVQAAVPKADVVVTNPEHLSVAIQYDEKTMHAPRVVAKGADFLALRIRQIARQHNVPVIERKPLARALYAQVQVGQEVPPEFYKTVAEILAFVYRMDGRMEEIAGHATV